jgi:hypothetical protein
MKKVLVLCAGVGLAVACAGTSDRVGTTREAIITPNSLNFEITSSSMPDRHELSTAFLNGPWGTPAPLVGHGRWVTVWNKPWTPADYGPCGFGYAYSPDGRAQNYWQPTECTGGGGASGYLQFGDPGPSPHTNLNFGGYLGDIAVAPLLGHDALGNDLSNGGRRSILVQIAKNDPASNLIRDDVVALLGDFDSSENLVWSHPAYVDTGPFSVPPKIDSGGTADIPHVATTPVAPNHTFASWETVQVSNNKAWLRQVGYEGYEASGSFCNGSGICTTALATPQQIPTAVGQDRRRPNISVGKLADANGIPLPCTSVYIENHENVTSRWEHDRRDAAKAAKGKAGSTKALGGGTDDAPHDAPHA